MNYYEINKDTLAILPFDGDKSKIIERDKTFIVNMLPMRIIEKSCEYFGSSYDGRFKGTKKLIGISYKAPIIIEETNETIFFPTNSPRLRNCAWISLKNLTNYKKDNNSSIIVFNNGNCCNLNISYEILDNQVLRAARLESVLRMRKQGL